MVNWEKQPLGEIPDAQIARAVGVTQAAVTYARQRRGILPCARTYRPGTYFDHLWHVRDTLLRMVAGLRSMVSDPQSSDKLRRAIGALGEAQIALDAEIDRLADEATK